MESAIVSGGYVYDHFMYSLVWGKYDFRWYDESRRIDRFFKLCFTDTEFFDDDFQCLFDVDTITCQL